MSSLVKCVEAHGKAFIGGACVDFLIDGWPDIPMELRGGRGEDQAQNARQQENYERMLRARSLLARQQYDEAFTIITQ